MLRNNFMVNILYAIQCVNYITYSGKGVTLL
jgi:hypothetical protein